MISSRQPPGRWPRPAPTMQVMTPALAADLYQSHVNPQWAKLLDLLEMNVQYDRCEGAELHAADGRTILDFLPDTGVHNVGTIIRDHRALREELERRGPAMLQSHVPDTAGELASRLFDCGAAISRSIFLQFRQRRRGSGDHLARANRTHRTAFGTRRVSRVDLRRAIADVGSVLEQRLRTDAAGRGAGAFWRCRCAECGARDEEIRGVHCGAGAGRSGA